MNLEEATTANMKYILSALAEKLQIVNRSIMDPEDYDIAKYESLKFMYDMVIQKGSLSASEAQAFLDELRKIRRP